MTGSVRAVDKAIPLGRCELWFGSDYIRTFPTWIEAEEARLAGLEERSGKAKKTFGMLGEKWLADLEMPAMKRDGYDYWLWQRSIWRFLKTAEFYDYEPRAVLPKHAQKWIDTLSSTNALQTVCTTKVDGKPGRMFRDTGRLLSAVRCRGAIGVAAQFWDTLIINGTIDAKSGNPFRLAKLPTRLERSGKDAKAEFDDEDDDSFDDELGDDEGVTFDEHQRIVHLTAAEVGKLFALDLEPFKAAAYALAIYAGLRRSEILGLQWRNIRLSGDKPAVNVQRGYGKKLKSKFSRRVVPLLPQAIPYLVAYRDWLISNGYKLTRQGFLFLRQYQRRGPSPHIHSAAGERFAKSYDFGWRGRGKGAQSRWCKGNRQRAGIRNEVVFHALRHTCGSHLLQGTWTGGAVSLQVVSKWLGHSSIVVTERHYATLTTSNLRAELDHLLASRILPNAAE